MGSGEENLVYLTDLKTARKSISAAARSAIQNPKSKIACPLFSARNNKPQTTNNQQPTTNQDFVAEIRLGLSAWVDRGSKCHSP